ncbi:hypothetical protein D3C76_1783660 [compost metagenome]
MIEFFRSCAKRATERRSNLICLLTVTRVIALLRLYHLRCNALFQQCLPGADDFCEDRFIHRAVRDRFHLLKTFAHVV